MRRRRRPEGGLDAGRVADALDRLAPPALAAEWDNVGLLAGDRRWPCRRALACGDLTSEVLDEAIAARCELIVAYHPPIFQDIRHMRIDARTSAEGIAAEALSRRIAIYSPHTAWDAAKGGGNDALAALCGVREARPFDPPSAVPGRESKLVVFVPPRGVDAVATALFEAGAGRIGEYSCCSFRTPGQGTFFGSEATAPAVGRRGRLERVDEIRLELVVPNDRLAAVAAALRRSHPYEEPAFDIYPLGAVTADGQGQGRVGPLSDPARLGEFARKLKRRLRAAQVSIVGRPQARIRRALVCVGSAGSLPFGAAGGGCGPGDVIVTGEMRHHDALRCLRVGSAAVLLGHWTSERPGIVALARRLQRELPSLDVRVSRREREPIAPA